MRPAPHANPDPSRELSGQELEWERIVEDPLSDELERLWKGQAQKNTYIADEIFQVVPSDRVRNWRDYKSFFVARGPRTGHVASEWHALEKDTEMHAEHLFRQTQICLLNTSSLG
jgi:phospholipase D1/2